MKNLLQKKKDFLKKVQLYILRKISLSITKQEKSFEYSINYENDKFKDKCLQLRWLEPVDNLCIDLIPKLIWRKQYNLNGKYLYFDFPKSPLSQVASLKILSSPIGVSKVSCALVPKSATESTMIATVNNAIFDGTNVCLDLGSSSKNELNEFNALINAKLDGDKYMTLIKMILIFQMKEIIL